MVLTLASSRPIAACLASARRAACRPAKPPARRVLAPLMALPGSDALSLDKTTKEELPNYLTLAAYAASLLARGANLSSFQLTASHVYTVVSLYTLVWGMLALADLPDASTRGQFDVVGAAIGPAFLAAGALDGFGKVTPFETAAFLFGHLLVDKLPKFKYSRWVWLATLAGALYKGLGAQWFVGAFGLSALWRLVQQYREEQGSIRYQEVPFIALAGWALYKQVELPLTYIIMLAFVATSAVA